jgi:membrane protein YdbS with pleckstrin-like domain
MTSQREHDAVSMRQAGSPETMTDTPAEALDTVIPAMVETPEVETPERETPDWPGSSDWQMLPARARRVFLYVALLIAVPPMCVASIMAYENLQQAWAWPMIGGLWAVALSFAVWVADKRYRYTFWKLDADGFSVRRGRLWQLETRVPTSRVQHLDIKRGPLERPHRLASLVLHTAGTRLNAVSISGLDDADAEHLRNHFSRQIDRQEDDDHADA